MAMNPSGFLPWGPAGPGGLSPLHGLSMKGQIPGDRRTLAQVAVETETQFLTQLLENLRKSLVQSLGSPQAEKMSGYQSLVDQHLARAMAMGGGLGLARQIFSDLRARIPEAGKETADGEQQRQRESDLAPAREAPL